MKTINITPFAFWAFCALAGYLIRETYYAALLGLAIGIGVSLIVTMVSK